MHFRRIISLDPNSSHHPYHNEIRFLFHIICNKYSSNPKIKVQWNEKDEKVFFFFSFVKEIMWLSRWFQRYSAQFDGWDQVKWQSTNKIYIYKKRRSKKLNMPTASPKMAVNNTAFKQFSTFLTIDYRIAGLFSSVDTNISESSLFHLFEKTRKESSEWRKQKIRQKLKNKICHAANHATYKQKT